MSAQPIAPLDTSGIELFLAREHAKTLLRFTTAGSVDDGKSTLIGRLLYDSANVYEDQVRSIARFSASRGNGQLDLSLLTDGLRAEREQGITIDVAYRYFSTARRRFIIADTPGHEQYTRNMATGASTADLAIILIDARNGVLPQSRRHACISALLGIQELAVAINKMDLVGFDERVFRSIAAEFTAVLAKLGRTNATFLPISALTGDNVVERSRVMPWYDGPSLLEHLETVETTSQGSGAPFRLPVQWVIRPDQNFRGFAGQIASGTIRPGDEVIALPSGRHTRVKRIAGFDGDRDLARAPESVTVTLEDEIDISRGDMLCSVNARPHVGRLFEANVVWMHEAALDPSRPLLLKHTAQTVQARVRSILNRVNLDSLDREPAETLRLNDIGTVLIETSKPLYFDAYQNNRATGSLILIDPDTNATAAAGMIARGVRTQTRDTNRLRLVDSAEPVTPAERAARFGHGGALLNIGDRVDVGEALERRLFEGGHAPVLLQRGEPAEFAVLLQTHGFLVLAPGPAPIELPRNVSRAAELLYNYLIAQRILIDGGQFTSGEGI